MAHNLLIKPPLDRVNEVVLEAVHRRDGRDWTLASAAGNPGLTLAELFRKGAGGPPGGGIFVRRLGRLVYRLFVPADVAGDVPDVYAKSVLLWDVKPAPYGESFTSFLAVGVASGPRVLVPMPHVPEVLKGRPDNVERTRAALAEYVVSITDAANVALLASRMLAPQAPE